MKPNTELSDTGEHSGLRVRRGVTGKKTFYYRYRQPQTKQLKQIKIGDFPSMTLAEARVELQNLKRQRKEGRCPTTERKASRRVEGTPNSETHAEQAFTVTELVELYLTHHIEDHKSSVGSIIPGARRPRGQIDVRNMLYTNVVNHIGDMPATQVTKKRVVELVMKIVERGANVQAGSVLRELSAAYDYAIGLGKLDDEFVNPALLAKTSLRQTKIKLTAKKGKRTLTDHELRKLLSWLPGSAYTSTQKNVLRFTLWTGCRTGEVCMAAWKDIDLDKGTFHIPETKTETARYVQLPRQAVEFLRALKLSTGEYPFASQRTKKPIQQKQLTEQAWRLRKSKRMLDIEHWVPHDLRRTVRTGLSRMRCPNEVGEAVLGHAKKGIEGTYDLHRYEAECKEWLQKWADHLDKLISESNEY